MGDFLTAVKTVRSQLDGNPGPTLTPVSTTQKAVKQIDPENAHNSEHAAAKYPTEPREHYTHAESPDEALEVLRSQPETDVLVATLKQLSSKDGYSPPFSLATPGALQAQIANTLVSSIIPTFWSALHKKDKALLITCLLNVTGVGAVMTKLRALSARTARTGHDGGSDQIRDLVGVANYLFRGDEFVARIWTGLNEARLDDIKRQLAWKEASNLLGSGRVVSIIAQAEDSVRKQDPVASSWLSRGPEYAAWLGRNVAKLVASVIPHHFSSSYTAAALLLATTLNLGYPAPLLKGLFTVLVHTDLSLDSEKGLTVGLIQALPAHARRRLLEQTAHWLSDLASSDADIIHEDATQLKKDATAVSGLLANLSEAQGSLISTAYDILTDPGPNASMSVRVRRSCLVTIATKDPDKLQPLLETSMAIFSDRLFIDHAPLLQQESLAQTLLLTAGYLHRWSPIAALMTARSSNHMQGVSNRLDTSGKKARWLGMVVATALSHLVDKEGSRMNFDVDEMRTEETRWYLGLVNLHDDIGTLSDFDALLRSLDNDGKPATRHAGQHKPVSMPMLHGKPVFGPPRPPSPVWAAQTEVIDERITELLDEESDEDDDLKPYEKPDDDPEDSDEDATLLNRNKPRAPVYIRDLMSMLKEDKDHDKFQLAIQHAAGLIRRKTNFGKEVKDHAEELLRILCNLQDPFDTKDFDELRLQAMIAVLLSDVETLGPWLSRQAFAGEYSLAQRCVILSAIGLSGRELAGYKDDDELNPAPSSTDFPTKPLPPRLHAIYAPADRSVKRLYDAFQNSEHQLIRPMALQAADQSTAHLNAVKIRTFSSRMNVERTKRKPQPNRLAKIFGQAFFLPLVRRYHQDIAAYGSSSVYSSASFVLTTFLKTLALLFHASGPATLDLSQITAEYWDMLLSLRVQAAGDLSVLEAELFSLLTVLEVNADKRRIAEEQPKQLVETQQWVEVIFERIGGGLMTQSNEEEAKVRTLAAGILVRTREVVEAYQKLLFGQVIA